MTESIDVPNGQPPILDTHIHLYLPKHYTHLNWLTPSNEVLYNPHSVQQYISCIPPALLSPQPGGSEAIHKGFVFVETDRCYSDPTSESDIENAWEWVLEEYSFVHSLSKSALYGQLVRGCVPWAPLHLGPDMLEKYYQKLLLIGGITEMEVDGRKVVDRKNSLLKGFRYLLQDKPRGTMLTSNFIYGLKWMGYKGLIFELGIDVRSTGVWQLEEAVEMIQKVNGPREGKNPIQTTFIINHLSKPPLPLSPNTLASNPVFASYTTHLKTLSEYPNTYIKLSGVFSELPPSSSLPFKSITTQIKPWVSTVFNIFGSKRVIWGSDWPVCNVGFYQNYANEKAAEGEVKGKQAWSGWFTLTTKLLSEELKLEREEREGVWGKNAAQVYGVDLHKGI